MRELTFVTALAGTNWRSYYQDLVVMLRSMARVSDLETLLTVVHDGCLEQNHIDYLRAQRSPLDEFYVDRRIYNRHGKSKPQYLLFEAWNPDVVKSKKAVVLGCDMVFLKSWQYFLEAMGPIRAWWETTRGCWNSGALLITKPLISSGEYHRLLSTPHDGGFGSDQRIINMLYEGNMQRHPTWVQEFNNDGGYKKETMIAHYIHKYYAAKSGITPFWKRLYQTFLEEGELAVARAPGYDYWCEVLKDG